MGGYTFYASALMLSRLFVSVRRVRLRNARAVTVRPFIEINIPEAERRFYMNWRGPSVHTGRLSRPCGGMAWSECLGDIKDLKTFRFSCISLRPQEASLYSFFYGIYFCLFLMITTIIQTYLGLLNSIFKIKYNYAFY